LVVRQAGTTSSYCNTRFDWMTEIYYNNHVRFDWMKDIYCNNHLGFDWMKHIQMCTVISTRFDWTKDIYDLADNKQIEI
jgi:hypothetical protein